MSVTRRISPDVLAGFLLSVIGLFTGIGGTSMVLFSIQSKIDINRKTEAVDLGYAEWVTDSSGVSTWQWKELENTNQGDDS